MDEKRGSAGLEARRAAVRKRKRFSGLKTTVAGLVVLALGMVGGVVLALIRATIGAFLLMWAASLVHSQVEAVPALGYLTSFGVLLGLSVLSSAARGGSTK